MAIVLALTVASAAMPGEAGLAEDIEELRKEQKEVEAKKKEQALDVDAATAESEDLTAALELLNAQVNEQTAKVGAAEQRLDAAEARHDVAVQAVAEKNDEIVVLEGQLSDNAITSFVTQNNSPSPILEEVDPNRAVRMQSLVETVTSDGISVADELKAVKEDLKVEQAEADAAAQEADDIRVELADDLAELEVRQDAQTELVEAAEERLEWELAEAWALSETDKELSNKIKKKNEELAAQAALARKNKKRTNPASGGKSPGFPSSGDIVNVQGIWVHRSIASNLDALLNHASSEGHSFSGGGYRDSKSQIRLRKAHCGSSNYAIYQMPSSQCRPPTARPGASQHEQGKAIDFRYNGRSISTRSSGGYKWLRANAAAYGFFNLPSEPWHWSVNGR